MEPRRDEERIPLRDALEQLAREDPSLKVSEDRASGQWLLEGMGELHIDIAVARLGVEFGVEPRLGPPRVAFREVVRLEASGAGTVERTLEGDRVHAEVELRLEPLPGGVLRPGRRGARPAGSGGGLDPGWSGVARRPGGPAGGGRLRPPGRPSSLRNPDPPGRGPLRQRWRAGGRLGAGGGGGAARGAQGRGRCGGGRAPRALDGLHRRDSRTTSPAA